MATTGFWPVKNRLKEVIDYARNPDKTIERKYLDDDLYATLEYAANADKTDETMYVSGINCSKFRAYEEMTAVKRRFGERGKVVAYHGYQSFRAGEVTAEEAHEIGIRTASGAAGRLFSFLRKDRYADGAAVLTRGERTCVGSADRDRGNTFEAAKGYMQRR